MGKKVHGFWSLEISLVALCITGRKHCSIKHGAEALVKGMKTKLMGSNSLVCRL
jgi:hypothetical protein